MTELPEKMKELLQLLRKTKAEEIDCDAFGEMAAQLAETDLALDIEELKIYKHHLELCPGCAEEFALLKEIADESR